jgi:hypothetical protein
LPAGAMSWFAMPTPMIEPISVWEELAGMPSAQAPRFQMIAAISRAKIMANPALLSTGRINSTGYRLMMPNATTPLEVGAAQSMDPCDCYRSVPVFVVNCLARSGSSRRRREGGGPLSESPYEHGERRPVAYDRNVTLARSGIF